VKDASFEVEPGQTVALVGSTGSGKSTTLGLLHRIFDPQEGRITIDGMDIRDMTLLSLRRNIGVVFQEPMLFARSIEENLQVGKPDASEEEIQIALERAQATDFIAQQTDGVKTIVGERGRSLSGGERQRLSIARALLKDPPIMIFDEATSALDATTERQLQAALDAATRGRTTFVIAHRLSTVRNADRIDRDRRLRRTGRPRRPFRHIGARAIHGAGSACEGCGGGGVGARIRPGSQPLLPCGHRPRAGRSPAG
jgi:ATP-binding cassette subfamily B protein